MRIKVWIGGAVSTRIVHPIPGWLCIGISPTAFMYDNAASPFICGHATAANIGAMSYAACPYASGNPSTANTGAMSYAACACASGNPSTANTGAMSYAACPYASGNPSAAHTGACTNASGARANTASTCSRLRSTMSPNRSIA